MKHFINLSAIITALMCLASCGTYQTVSRVSEYTNQYVGQNHNYIVQRWGPPTRQTSDGAGGTILIYENSVQKSNAVADNVNPIAGTYNPAVLTQTFTSYANFFIGDDSICYKVQTNQTKEVWVPASKKQKKAIYWILGGTGAICILCLIAGASGA